MGTLPEQIYEQIKAALGKKKSATDVEKQDSLELIQKLKTMDSAYKSAKQLPAVDPKSVPETLGLQPKIYLPRSESEILEEAQVALQPAYEKSVDKLQSTKDATLDKLDTSAENAEYDYQKDIQVLEGNVEKQSEAHKADMITQGLVNSSINAGGQDAILSAYEAESAAAKAAYELNLDEIAGKISKAILDFDNALMQYDLQYAASLEAKTVSLKLEQEKLKEQVNAYNKKIAEQELKYKQERLKTLAALEDERLKNQAELEAKTKAYEKEHGYEGEKAEEMESRYRLAYDTYNKLDKEVALSLINADNESLKETLGLYYQRLIDAVMAK